MDKVHSNLFTSYGQEIAAHAYLHRLKFFKEFYIPVVFTQEASQEVIVCKADLLKRTKIRSLLQVNRLPHHKLLYNYEYYSSIHRISKLKLSCDFLNCNHF